jgi:hypothetical protein
MVRDGEDTGEMCTIDQELEVAGEWRCWRTGKMGGRAGKADLEAAEDNTDVALGRRVKPRI